MRDRRTDRNVENARAHFANLHCQYARTLSASSFITREYKHNNIACVFVIRNDVKFNCSVDSSNTTVEQQIFPPHPIGSLSACGTYEDRIRQAQCIKPGNAVRSNTA